MAIITPGPTVAAISGSIGGTVYSRNRGGAYIRNRAIPVDPNTAFQQNIRAVLANQSQAWADLTNEQRTAWEGWAVANTVTNALGNQIRLSGHQAFVQINARLDFTDLTQLVVPPITNAPTGLDTMVLSADIGVGTFDIAYTATPIDADVSIWVAAAIVSSPGIKYVRNLYRFILLSTAAQASPLDFQTELEARLGTVTIGQTVHVRVATFDNLTGLMSFPLTDSAVVESTV